MKLFSVKSIIAVMVLCAVFFCGAVRVQALEYPGIFHIDSILVSGETNYHFRVISDNYGHWLCYLGPKSTPWAYLNKGDDGFDAKYATLMTAYLTGQLVKIVTSGVSNGAGGRYCHIEQVQIFNDY